MSDDRIISFTIPFPKEKYLRSHHGWGCGYVAIPSTHPLYKLTYKQLNKLDNPLSNFDSPDCIPGEITYTDYVKNNWKDFIPINDFTHIKNNNYWIIGWDTAHGTLEYDCSSLYPEEIVKQCTEELKNYIENYSSTNFQDISEELKNYIENYSSTNFQDSL